MYLREFYIGELFADDIIELQGGAQRPSQAFLDELNRHTHWRLKPEDMHSLVATHLGGGKLHSLANADK